LPVLDGKGVGLAPPSPNGTFADSAGWAPQPSFLEDLDLGAMEPLFRVTVQDYWRAPPRN
jgi:hypothetical protein